MTPATTRPMKRETVGAQERTAASMLLFVEYRATGDRALRNQLVEEHRDLADYFVKRYSRRAWRATTCASSR